MAHDVQNRFYEEENNDSQEFILHIIGVMFGVTVFLWSCVFCGCGSESSTINEDTRPLCDGLVVATVLDALFGGDRRQRALRQPFGR